VNSNYHTEHPGWAEDSANTEDGASYLRRLKGTLDATPSPDPPAQTAKAATSAKDVGDKERRLSPRYRCSGSAEFRAEGGTGRMWGTLTDISLHGCYIEMNTTFPVDTKVELVLKSCGIQVKTEGTVRASYPALGMGVRFSRIDREDESQLQKLVAHVGGFASIALGAGVHVEPDAQEAAIQRALQTADPADLLDAIKEFFGKNRLLSRSEFHLIARGVRRA